MIMSDGIERMKSNVARTGAEVVHDREKAADRVLKSAEDEYLDLASELIDARKMMANAIAEADHVQPDSSEGKKLAERIEALGLLVTQMQLLLDDEVESINEISARHEALKAQMKPHLN
jgi:hypothetical protein